MTFDRSIRELIDSVGKSTTAGVTAVSQTAGPETVLADRAELRLRPLARFFDGMAVNLDAQASADTVVAVGFEFTDSAERYTYMVRRGASEVVPQLREDADIVVRVPAQVFKEMLAQLRNPAVTIAKDFEVVKGGKLGFVRFMRLFVPVEE